MKPLTSYLVESIKTYSYTIKMVGDVQQNFIDLFVHNLSKFTPVKIGSPKTTPIQSKPRDFENFENQPVTILNVEFKYPATEPMIQQVAKLLGFDVNRIRVMTQSHHDSIEQEDKEKSEQPSPLLTAAYDDGDKQASKDYANQYLDKVVPKKPTIDMKFAAPLEKPPTERKSTKKSLSPLSKINLPPKAKAGNGQ